MPGAIRLAGAEDAGDWPAAGERKAIEVVRMLGAAHRRVAGAERNQAVVAGAAEQVVALAGQLGPPLGGVDDVGERPVGVPGTDLALDPAGGLERVGAAEQQNLGRAGGQVAVQEGEDQAVPGLVILRPEVAHVRGGEADRPPPVDPQPGRFDGPLHLTGQPEPQTVRLEQ